MLATKIKLKPLNCMANHALEIDEIYLTDCVKDGYFKKEDIHDYLVRHPQSIRVGRAPYPFLYPIVSKSGKKCVRSQPDGTHGDNLLELQSELPG